MSYNLPVLWFCCHQVCVHSNDSIWATLLVIESVLGGELNPYNGAAAPFELTITAGSDLSNAEELLGIARDQFDVKNPCRTIVSALQDVYEQVMSFDYECAKLPTEAYCCRSAQRFVQSDCIPSNGDRMISKEDAKGT